MLAAARHLHQRGPGTGARRRCVLFDVALLIAALSLLAGCSSYRLGLGAIKADTGGRLLPVRRDDFPTGDPREGAAGAAQGSRVLAYAVQGHGAVAAAVREHGIPDAVAITGGSGLAVDLAYLAPPTLRTVALVGFWRTESSARPLTDAEIAQVDPERILQAQADRLREAVALRGRLEHVGRSMLRASAEPSPAPPVYGVLLVEATPAAARLYGGAVSEQQQVVAWVDPHGPQRAQLHPGDRILAVNDTNLAAPGTPGMQWSGPVRLALERDGVRSEVVVEPERLPFGIAFLVVDDDRPNAMAREGAVLVTTGLLRTAASDDLLAAALGHEIAHIALGHTKTRLTAVGAFSGLVRTVMLPLDIVQPRTSALFTGPFEALADRFDRDQERDADRVGLQYAKTAGYDPAAALVLIDTLQEQVPVGGVDQFLDIHPPYPERRTLIAAELERLR